eukprot:COSAG02_NODE_5653_length_4149_cov_3.358765_1_plen_726_part_00
MGAQAAGRGAGGAAGGAAGGGGGGGGGRGGGGGGEGGRRKWTQREKTRGERRVLADSHQHCQELDPTLLDWGDQACEYSYHMRTPVYTSGAPAKVGLRVQVAATLWLATLPAGRSQDRSSSQGIGEWCGPVSERQRDSAGLPFCIAMLSCREHIYPCLDSAQDVVAAMTQQAPARDRNSALMGCRIFAHTVNPASCEDRHRPWDPMALNGWNITSSAAKIRDAAGIPAIVSAMSRFPDDVDVQVACASALGRLAQESPASQTAINLAGGVEVLAAAIDRHSTASTVMLNCKYAMAAAQGKPYCDPACHEDDCSVCHIDPTCKTKCHGDWITRDFYANRIASVTGTFAGSCSLAQVVFAMQHAPDDLSVQENGIDALDAYINVYSGMEREYHCSDQRDRETCDLDFFYGHGKDRRVAEVHDAGGVGVVVSAMRRHPNLLGGCDILGVLASGGQRHRDYVREAGGVEVVTAASTCTTDNEEADCQTGAPSAEPCHNALSIIMPDPCAWTYSQRGDSGPVSCGSHGTCRSDDAQPCRDSLTSSTPYPGFPSGNPHLDGWDPSDRVPAACSLGSCGCTGNSCTCVAAVCDCDDGFIGDRCQHDVRPDDVRPEGHTVLVASLVTICSCCCCCFHCCRKYRRTNRSSEPSLVETVTTDAQDFDCTANPIRLPQQQVVCPPNCSPGDLIVVETSDGRQVQVRVPTGVKPCEPFLIDLGQQTPRIADPHNERD